MILLNLRILSCEAGLVSVFAKGCMAVILLLFLFKIFLLTS